MRAVRDVSPFGIVQRYVHPPQDTTNSYIDTTGFGPVKRVVDWKTSKQSLRLQIDAVIWISRARRDCGRRRRYQTPLSNTTSSSSVCMNS